MPLTSWHTEGWMFADTPSFEAENFTKPFLLEMGFADTFFEGTGLELGRNWSWQVSLKIEDFDQLHDFMYTKPYAEIRISNLNLPFVYWNLASIAFLIKNRSPAHETKWKMSVG